LIFGDGKGVIRIFNRDFAEIQFQAYDIDVIGVHQLKRSNVLVAMGNDSGNDGTAIKIYRLDKEDVDGRPVCVRTIKIFNSKFPPVAVTCFAVLEDLTQLAIGLGNGAVMLFDGNLLRDRACKYVLTTRRRPR
jgi:vacuolar protein sorting-associated protein 11